MGIEIREVRNRNDLKKFVKMPFQLYKGNAYWVPPLIRDEMEIFDREKNPAFENADSKQFIAYKDGKIAGRIAAIISQIANEKYNTHNIRFGWFDTVDDFDVARALFNTVEDWGRSLGLKTVTGPHGFTDMDPEGMLIEGFEELSTIAEVYTYPYYPALLERYGFEKEIDYVEFKTTPPHETGIPKKLISLAERIKQRSSFKILEFRNKKEVIARAEEIFDLLDEAYEEIYGAVPLTRNQIQYYIKKYFPFVDKDMVKVVVNDKDEVIGFLLTMPSMSRAFQKARGRLLPFGWIHLLRALKTYEIIDFYLAAIRKKYRGLGVDLMMVVEIAKLALKRGFKTGESNLELETNTKVQAQWKYFNPQMHKRRRIFRKQIP